jgi:hypothetical protein
VLKLRFFTNGENEWLLTSCPSRRELDGRVEGKETTHSLFLMPLLDHNNLHGFWRSRSPGRPPRPSLSDGLSTYPSPISNGRLLLQYSRWYNSCCGDHQHIYLLTDTTYLKPSITCTCTDCGLAAGGWSTLFYTKSWHISAAVVLCWGVRRSV